MISDQRHQQAGEEGEAHHQGDHDDDALRDGHDPQDVAQQSRRRPGSPAHTETTSSATARATSSRALGRQMRKATTSTSARRPGQQDAPPPQPPAGPPAQGGGSGLDDERIGHATILAGPPTSGSRPRDRRRCACRGAPCRCRRRPAPLVGEVARRQDLLHLVQSLEHAQERGGHLGVVEHARLVAQLGARLAGRLAAAAEGATAGHRVVGVAERHEAARARGCRDRPGPRGSRCRSTARGARARRPPPPASGASRRGRRRPSRGAGG